VAGGGDGTVSFVCSLLDHFLQDYNSTQFTKPVPPIAILPIGVGNELSRCLGWSKAFSPSSKSIFCCSFENKEKAFIKDVRRGRIVDLDSWDVYFEPDSQNGSDWGFDYNFSCAHGKIGKHTLMCFFSLGFDASITHKFHQLRETKPKLTSSVAGNKLWYTVFGIQEMLMPMDNVSSYLELRVDGQLIPLPSDIKTLQLFNIHSSADGIDFFGVSRPSHSHELQEYSSPTITDGLLEAVGTTGVPHLLSIRCYHGKRF